ncbi:uncharacterized protein PG986_003058 [Apiospora aurea]|uniref:Uncharacterized protein n=1 Tax=Apiospora aurea TaxID=335848 RepID=A0ABR1QR20_9PEZI
MAAPVGLAISLGLEKVVRHLFSRGADANKPLILSEELVDPDLTPASQNNVLHMACANGAWDMTKMLWREGFCTNVCGRDAAGQTPLHYALHRRNWTWLLGPVEWLTELGVDPVQQADQQAGSPKPARPLKPAEVLDAACEQMDFELALRLLDLGADARKTLSALVACCRCPPPSPRTHRAKYRAQIQLVRRLLRGGADVNQRWCDTTALRCAQVWSNMLVAGILQEAGARDTMIRISYQVG